MVRAMCGVKLLEKKRTEDLKMEILRRDDGHVCIKALEFEVKGKRK